MAGSEARKHLLELRLKSAHRQYRVLRIYGPFQSGQWIPLSNHFMAHSLSLSLWHLSPAIISETLHNSSAIPCCHSYNCTTAFPALSLSLKPSSAIRFSLLSQHTHTHRGCCCCFFWDTLKRFFTLVKVQTVTRRFLGCFLGENIDVTFFTLTLFILSSVPLLVSFII